MLTSRRFQHGFHRFNRHRPTTLMALALRNLGCWRRSGSWKFTGPKGRALFRFPNQPEPYLPLESSNIPHTNPSREAEKSTSLSPDPVSILPSACPPPPVCPAVNRPHRAVVWQQVAARLVGPAPRVHQQLGPDQMFLWNFLQFQFRIRNSPSLCLEYRALALQWPKFPEYSGNVDLSSMS